MEVMPILRALRRNKVGATLVALQLALTLAVVANALSVIQHHWTDMTRPSGLDEANVFSMTNQWLGQPDDLQARVETDIAALRGIPGVIDAEATFNFPMSGSNFSGNIGLKPGPVDRANADKSVFQHGSRSGGSRSEAYGGPLVTADEVGKIKMWQVGGAPSVVLSASLATRLFPDGHALGRSVYVISDTPMRVVGIVQTASSVSGARFNADFSTFLPFQVVNNFLVYVVRTQPGQQRRVMVAAKERLLGISRVRVLSQIQTFSESRTKLFASAAATSWLLTTGMHLVAGDIQPAARWA